jgi:hypothetical protein
MSTTPEFPDRPTPLQLASPRAALCDCLDEARRALERSREKVAKAETSDQLCTAAASAHLLYVTHGETMRECLRTVLSGRD